VELLPADAAGGDEALPFFVDGRAKETAGDGVVVGDLVAGDDFAGRVEFDDRLTAVEREDAGL
jgi:hypothetical protein